jgi:hypothetical protein
LSIVCFRYRAGDDAMQAAIAADLQEAGEVVLSTTVLQERVVLRAATVNHRTRQEDVGTIVTAVVAAGARRRYRRGKNGARRVMARFGPSWVATMSGVAGFEAGP